jgi:hypothetical protein
MSCSADRPEVWECTFCGTQFVKGIADPGPNGEPRCPQCLIYDARPLASGEIGEFVVAERTRFR